jgi:hypothetical protein
MSTDPPDDTLVTLAVLRRLIVDMSALVEERLWLSAKRCSFSCNKCLTSPAVS